MRKFLASALLLTLGALSFGQGTGSQPKLLLDSPVSVALRPTTPYTAKLRQRLVSEANRTLNRPLETYTLVMNSLLTTSRDVLADTMTLALAYRETGDVRYFNRAVLQLRVAADFPDWYPGHFLGTAEMSLAMAVGLDWLRNDLSPEDRALFAQAITEKGLKPAVLQYGKRADWTRRGTNWSQVCGASIAMAAIAVEDTEPVLSARILRLTIPTVQRALREFAPAGIPDEGPVYWRYGMAFHTMLNRTLVNRFGPSRSILNHPAYAATAWYPMTVLGPSGKNFNPGDASEWFVPSPATLELARETGQPAVAWWTEQRVQELLDSPQTWTEEHRLSSLFLAWNMVGTPIEPGQVPLDRAMLGDQHIVTMRGSWDDKNTSFVGIRSGKNGLAHGQLDLGTFVFDALGERWATDLGKDRYDLPGYFSRQRYTYYRNMTASHNTLFFGGNQALRSSATTRTGLNTDQPWVQLDLTRAYSGSARQILRGFQLVNRRDLLVTDQVVQARQPWRWQMVTEAEVELSGRFATLSRNGKRVTAEIIAPQGATFEVGSTDPGDVRQNPNRGTRMLMVQMPAGSAQIQVALRPVQP